MTVLPTAACIMLVKSSRRTRDRAYGDCDVQIAHGMEHRCAVAGNTAAGQILLAKICQDIQCTDTPRRKYNSHGAIPSMMNR